MNITCRCITDIGPRQIQQDSLLAGSHVLQGDYKAQTYTLTGENRIFAVCDGLGCFAGSGIISKYICEQLAKIGPLKSISADDIRDQLSLIQKRSEITFKKRIGTTIAGLAVGRGKLTVFNAGDSRVYKISKTGIKCISHDHSLVQQLIDSGLINEQEAREHPHRNVVSLGMGSCFPENLRKEQYFIEEFSGDEQAFYLICSDGVHGSLIDEEIFAILKEDPIKNSDILHGKLKDKGLSDNTSLIVIKIENSL